MDIDEFAHALGVVFRRPPLGDLDLAPGTMHVEDDEEIGGAVAAVLVIVAFELARLGRDWLAHLADELDRAFVEADHRPLGIRRFGIEIEHVFHAGDVFAIDLGNAPHVLAPRLEVILGQPPTHRLARQALVFGELDHRAGQQLQRPAGAALRRVRAGGRHQQGFFLAGELALRPRTRLFAQRPLQIAFHEAPLGPVDGGAADRHGAGNLLVAAAGVGRQQYLRSLELAGGMLAAAQHRGEFARVRLGSIRPDNVHSSSASLSEAETNRPMNQKSGAARRPTGQASPKSRASIWPSSTPIRACSDARPPRPTCSATSASAHPQSTR